MNKSQLIDTLAARFEGNRKAAAHALDSVLDTITREVAKGEKVAITGFGSFERKVRQSRWVRNPRTGDRVQAKQKSVPAFKPGAQLRDVVSGAKKLPALTLATIERTTPAAAGDVARAAARAVTGGKTSKTKAKSAPAKKAPATKSATKKAAAASSAPTAKKSTAKKSTAKTSTAKKSTAKKASAKKASTAKKSTAKKASAAKKSTAKKASTAKKSTAKKSTPPASS